MENYHRTRYIQCLLLLVIFASCTTSPSVKKESAPISAGIVKFDLEKIFERDTLKALVDNSSTSYFIYKGHLMGYEYELLNMLAKQMGVTLEIILTSSIDEAFEKLNNGKGDIIAFTLTVTKERKEKVAFTRAHYTTHQVLVQKKPKGWRRLSKASINRQLIRNQVDLIGKKVHVRKSSSYATRLKHLSDEIGGDILIIEDKNDVETEMMIKLVAQDSIQYTVADEDIAFVNMAYYPDLDIKTPISFPQQIAWAVRLNAPNLLSHINDWRDSLKKTPTNNILYSKYYKSHRASRTRFHSDFSSIKEDGRISPYDDIIKRATDTLGWDWRLIAAQIFQESTFNPQATSWAGAVGLMQLMPDTGKRFGVSDLTDPKQSIKAGVTYMHYLYWLWAKTIDDENERMKFALASYNIGLGHVIDARELSKKYGADPTKWEDNVADYLRKKSKPKYFKDKVVRSGYCRGDEPIRYVRAVMTRYDQYKHHLDE